MLKIYYRISEAGYNKVKPSFINNENCLRNFVKHFDPNIITVIADNVGEETFAMISKYVPVENIQKHSVGNGAGTFNLALDQALKLEDETTVYFVENDYLHRAGARKVLEEIFLAGVSYVTLYDHPDKYVLAEHGGNKLCKDGPEITRVLVSQHTHWKVTNSTTMTFAAKVKTLKADEDLLRKYTNGIHPENGKVTGHPYDFSMFLELNARKRILISPIPGYSTHGETYLMSPLINWQNEVDDYHVHLH